MFLFNLTDFGEFSYVQFPKFKDGVTEPTLSWTS